MVLSCVASSKPALPSILRSIFRAELASEPHLHSSLYNQSGLLSLHLAPLRSRRFQSERCFSSVPRFQTAQSEQPASSASSSSSDKPSTATDTHEDKKPQSQKSARGARNWRDAKPKERAPRPAHQKKKKPEEWQIQKDALTQKFASGWNPRKKLSPDALDGIRHLHAMAPDRFTTPVLAEEFKVSPEAIRRILKSKWRASEPQMDDRRKRWEKRHDKIWSQMAELGLRPKVKRHQPITDVNVLYDDSDTTPRF